MSLSQKIAAVVAELAASHASPACVHAEEGRHQINLNVTLATPMGLECEAIDFRADDAETSFDSLKAWGNRIAGRVTYLMEPLKVLEADPLDGSVLLRSQGPTPKNGRRSYFEVRLNQSGSATFDRIAYDEAAKTRQAVPCQFTAEVFERLVDDLVATSS